MTKLDSITQQIASDLPKSLVQARVQNSSVFMSTGVSYPNGVGVMVRLDGSADNFLVSDDGYASFMAETMSGRHSFAMIAKGVADRAGINYESGVFRVNSKRSTLPSSISSVANASARAIDRLLASLEKPKLKRSREIFNKRLSEAFGGSIVFDVEFRGATGKSWEFNAGLQEEGGFTHLFEFVAPSMQAVAIANLKILDTRALIAAPSITAALSDYDNTDPALRSILSGSGGLVISANDDVSRYRMRIAS
ncbi:MAG: hypothetical protein Q7T73_03670 [Beijerinckiaceae bacterium]|nr:hypothetical protein [Beijerinckiaceae bacterium]